MVRGNLDESYFIDPLGRDLDPERDRAVPEGASVYLRGWAYFSDPDRAAAGVSASIDDGPRFALAYNQDRPDVVRALDLRGLTTIGFHGIRSLAGLALGPHVLHLWCTEPDTGVDRELGEGSAFETIAGSYVFPRARELEDAMVVTFDYLTDTSVEADARPESDLRVARGTTVLAMGWAVDLANRVGASDAYACIDGTTFVRGIVGRMRRDAAASVGIPEAWRCGYTIRIPTAHLAPGPHRVHVRVLNADGGGYQSTVERTLELV